RTCESTPPRRAGRWRSTASASRRRRVCAGGTSVRLLALADVLPPLHALADAGAHPPGHRLAGTLDRGLERPGVDRQAELGRSLGNAIEVGGGVAVEPP